VTPGLPLSPHPCNPFALVASPKLRLQHNVSVNDINEWKACYAGKEMEDLEVTSMRGRMMSW